jgi:hypothetical protein
VRDNSTISLEKAYTLVTEATRANLTGMQNFMNSRMAIEAVVKNTLQEYGYRINKKLSLKKNFVNFVFQTQLEMQVGNMEDDVSAYGENSPFYGLDEEEMEDQARQLLLDNDDIIKDLFTDLLKTGAQIINREETVTDNAIEEYWNED